MSDADLAAVVAAVRLSTRSWSQLSAQLRVTGDPLALLDAELSRGPQSLLSPAPEQLIEAAATDLSRWRKAGLTVLTVLDDGYPFNLRTVHDRPPLLFVSGTPTTADRRSLAVVGSRQPTPGGLARARELSRHLVAHGYTVVSGLAAGIDTAAHRQALADDGRSVAVIGTGHEHAYPPENAQLQAALNAVWSPFRPEIGPSRHTFPERNRVMSGLALGTAIVEASMTSGTRIQARHALAHGRPVFLAQPLLTQRWARELAERPGVHVYVKPPDVTELVAQLSDRALTD